MDKLTSVIAALDANKLPSTQQFVQFIDWIEKVVLAEIQPSEAMVIDMPELTAQGKVLSNDLREIFEAHKALAVHKNRKSTLLLHVA